MDFTAQVIVRGDAEDIFKCIKPELHDDSSSFDRASFTVQVKKGELVFDVKAKDSVALRATLNSITQLLTIYEKIENMRMCR